MSFSTKLKELRKDRNLTQEQLGEFIGISRSAVAMYESGEREPDFKTEESFAEFFNVTLDYLRGRDRINVALSLSSHEQTVITAYRDQPEKQPQVDTILGVEPTILPLRMAAAEGDTKSLPSLTSVEIEHLKSQYKDKYSDK